MSSMGYQDLVADSALELWFPDGLNQGQTVKEYSYEDDVVKQHVMPLLPAGSTRVEALAMCLDSTVHDAIKSFGLKKLDHELDRVEIWTSHPLGWVLKNKVRPHGRLMVVGAPADGSRMDQAWPVDKKQGVEFGFQKKCIYFMEYPQFKQPLAEHHWCVLVTYRLPSLKVKAPAKLTRAAVETMLTTVIKTFSTTHATSLPDAKKLKEVAKKRYGDQRCTVFEFLNAYQLDMAAKVGGDPLKLPPPVPRPKTKGVQGPTDDELDETEAETAAAASEAKTNGKGKKKAVKKVAVETMCQARRWLAPWANQVGPEVMIRVTDAPFAKEDLLRACRGESTNTYLSNARDVVNAILAFIDGPEAPPAFVNPRCVDIHNTIPCDAFNQRVSSTEEMIRVCDRFVLRLKALRQLSPAQRVAMVQCTTPVPSEAPSGLLREDALRVLEHVTQLELAAVVGLRQLSQWRTSFWCFYSKALEPLHGDEVHASLEICQVFFDRTLQLFTQRTPAPCDEVTPKRPRPPVAKKKTATTKTADKSTTEKKKKKKKPNGKAEVSDAGSGSESSSSDSDSSGDDSSSSDEDDEPKAKRAKAGTDDDEDEEEEEKEDPLKANQKRQSMLFLQRIETATKLNPEEVEANGFSRLILPRKTPDLTKQDPLKHPMELNPAIHGFFLRLCKAVNLKGYTSRLGDGGRSSGYVFQVPNEAESFIILPFDPFAPSPTTGVDLRNGLEATGCVVLSNKPNSLLEKAYLDLGRRAMDAQRLLDGMNIPKRPSTASDDEVVPMET